MRAWKFCALLLFVGCSRATTLQGSEIDAVTDAEFARARDSRPDTEDAGAEEPRPSPVSGSALGDVMDSEKSDLHEPAGLYADDRLPVFKLTVSDAHLERLSAEPREYVPAELELSDAEASEHMLVGLRLKGEGSFRGLDGKAAFRVKIDKYHSGQRLRGRRALTLNNMVQDRSMMSERLAYTVFRDLGVPASKVNHALVYVNGEYYGLYANIETPNEDFLAHWFDDPNRNLYEENGRDFDDARAAKSFEIETNERQFDERERLIALEQACSEGDLSRAHELVDWPRFLLFSAVEAAVNQVDGYSYAQAGPNNYRIYDTADGFVFIPWGLDWAFSHVMTQDRGLFLDPLWVRPQHGVLMRMCLDDEACTRSYRDVVARVAARWDELALEELMSRWSAQTQAGMEADSRREYSLETILDEREVRREFIRGRAQALREAIE